jgi:hypothetical protein
MVQMRMHLDSGVTGARVLHTMQVLAQAYAGKL